MARIIEEAETIETSGYDLVFDLIDCPGAAYAFPCDADGVVLPVEAGPAAENLQKCITGEHKVKPGKVKRWQNRYRQPALLECDCGAHVDLGHFTNTCDECGADYDSRGSRLAPREQWGEETGEHWIDIYNLNC